MQMFLGGTPMFHQEPIVRACFSAQPQPGSDPDLWVSAPAYCICQTSPHWRGTLAL